MAMQFEYDEKGGTFYYFLLSFMALVLIPGTYYLWPRSEKKDTKKKRIAECNCDPCIHKAQRIKSAKPFKKLKKTLLRVAILIAWVLFAFVAYKTSQVELDWTEFDPYLELGIDRESTQAEVKKAYRKLSLIYHPDRETGDSVKFMRISKAHQALTDEDAMENWKTYGNPDGPGATHFGIALPKWIVEKQNSVWVLGAYGLVFMIILPVVVGTWWYRSIKFSSEQILMDTARLYNIFIQKTPGMILKRVIMILAASFEFDKGHNSEISQRPSDNENIPRLMKYLPNLGEKNKERPLCFLYSIKARALIHAHMLRLIDKLSPELKQDKDYILKKAPYLLNEMVSVAAQHVALSHAGKARMPKLSTLEHMMRVSQMLVQGLWENSNPLLQLPHVSEDILKHFVTKKRNIRSIERFVSLADEERRLLLRTLSELQYQDVMNVCRAMPLIHLDANTEVKDDDDNNIITAGSIVTVTVVLTRKDMSCVIAGDEGAEPGTLALEDDMEPEEEEAEPQTLSADTAQKNKPKVWEKQKKKVKGKNKKKPGKGAAPAGKKVTTAATGAPGAAIKDATGDDSNHSTPKKTKSPDNDSANEEDSAGSDDDLRDTNDVSDDDDSGAAASSGGLSPANGEVQDEEVWEEMQRDLRKANKLETKSKETHLVHCPHYPALKYEWWWLYIADRKKGALITAPIHVCSLKDSEEFQMKFSAPYKPGHYAYTVILRSDCYLDFDIFKNIKLDVREAKKIENVKQWDFSDDEEEKLEEDLTESDDMSDTDDDDDDY